MMDILVLTCRLCLSTTMKRLLVLAMMFVTIYTDLGPCRKVHPVYLDLCHWNRSLYLNVYTQNLGQVCSRVTRWLNYTDDGRILLGETYRRLINGSEVDTTLDAQFIDKGHYNYTVELTAGKLTVLQVYFLSSFSLDVDIHYVCTDDPEYRNGRGTGNLYIESIYPDGPKKYAEQIKEVIEKNGFDMSELRMINNCNCSKVPDFGERRCGDMTLKEYFSS